MVINSKNNYGHVFIDKMFIIFGIENAKSYV